MDLKIITEQLGIDSIYNRQFIRSALLDYYPDEKQKTNLLVAACENGVARDIASRTSIPQVDLDRYIARLIDDYGMDEGNAEYVVRSWAEAFDVRIPLARSSQKDERLTKQNGQNTNGIQINGKKYNASEALIIINSMMLQESIAASHVNRNALCSHDKILFRGVSWYSTKTQVEDTLHVHKTSEIGEGLHLHRIGDSENDWIKGNIGVHEWYNCSPVAGYQPYWMLIDLLFPISDDGTIIRDVNAAQLYQAQYDFKSEIQDHVAWYYDMFGKLSKLYGNGIESEDDYYKYSIWKDDNNNIVQLQASKRNKESSIIYMAGDAHERLRLLQAALQIERMQEEDAIRREKANDFSGL